MPSCRVTAYVSETLTNSTLAELFASILATKKQHAVKMTILEKNAHLKWLVYKDICNQGAGKIWNAEYRCVMGLGLRF